MGKGSYILVGQGNPLSFCSCCHGAGRAKSRMQASKNWKGKDALGFMQRAGILIKASSKKTIDEEMPDAYKEIDQVVEAAEEAGLAKKVARLRPALVIKG